MEATTWEKPRSPNVSRGPRGQRGHAAVGDDHALGPAGGAGGVDDVGRVDGAAAPAVGVGEVGVRAVGVGTRRVREVGRGAGRGAGQVGCHVLQQQRLAVLRQRVRGLPGGEDEGGGRVGEHEADALGRVGGVDRQVAGARLQDGPQHRQQAGGARQAQRHEGLRTRAARREQTGEAVGAPVQTGVVQPGVAAGHSGAVGRPGHLLLEQRGERGSAAGAAANAGGFQESRNTRRSSVEIAAGGRPGSARRPFALPSSRWRSCRAIRAHGRRVEQVGVGLDRSTWPPTARGANQHPAKRAAGRGNGWSSMAEVRRRPAAGREPPAARTSARPAGCGRGAGRGQLRSPPGQGQAVVRERGQHGRSAWVMRRIGHRGGARARRAAPRGRRSSR
ncbi:hypothetical protein SFUMM280S_00273 [Streptomyces fumanus]